MTKIRFERSTKPSKHEKVAQGKSGFIPVAARWGNRALECLDAKTTMSHVTQEQ